jgi:hypothetical protein
MDRNGKKAKATASTTNVERSDLKTESHDTSGRAADASRNASGESAPTKRSARTAAGRRTS